MRVGDWVGGWVANLAAGRVVTKGASMVDVWAVGKELSKAALKEYVMAPQSVGLRGGYSVERLVAWSVAEWVVP